MGERTEVGYKKDDYSVVVLSAATALGTTDTSVINWPQVSIDGAVAVQNDWFTVTTTAAAGSQIALRKPGRYFVELNIALAGAGVLQGGISLGGTQAPFVAPPIDFSVGAAGFLAINGAGTLATTRPLVNCSVYIDNSRADVDTGTANILRLCATVGVTLDADNTRCRIHRLGGNGQF